MKVQNKHNLNKATILKMHFKNTCNSFLDKYCLIKVLSYINYEKLELYKFNIFNKFLFTNILMNKLDYNSNIIPIIKNQTKVDILSFVGETWLDHDERSLCMFEMNLNVYLLVFNEGTDNIELWLMRDTSENKDFIKLKNLLKVSVVFKDMYSSVMSKINITLRSLSQVQVRQNTSNNSSIHICISCINDINIQSCLYKIQKSGKTLKLSSIGKPTKYKIDKEFHFSFTHQPKITNLFNTHSPPSSMYLTINYINSNLHLVNLTQNQVKRLDIGFNTNINCNYIIYINNITHLVIFAKYVVCIYNISKNCNYKLFGDFRTNYINGKISNNKVYCVSKCGTGINNNKSGSVTQIFDWNSNKLIKTIQGLFRLDYYSIFFNWKSTSNKLKNCTNHSYFLVCDNNLNNEIRVFDTYNDEFIWIINSIKSHESRHNMDEDIQFNNDYSSVRGDRDGEILHIYQSKELNTLYIVFCESRIIQNYKIKKITY